MLHKLKDKLLRSASAESAQVLEKCHREFEARYTVKLTMEEVLRWLSENKAISSRSILVSDKDNVYGIYKVRQSMIDSDDTPLRDRMICALELEESLNIKLQQGNGVCVFES